MDGLSGLKLRRIPALFLFFLLGPVLLLGVLGLVCYRRSSVSRAEEEASLTELFHLRTTLTDAEYVRPKTKAYFGITAHTAKTDTPFLFCPEILIRPLQEGVPSPSLQFGEEYGRTEIDSIAAKTDREEWLIPDLYLQIQEWRNFESFFHIGERLFPKGGIYFRIGHLHLVKSETLFEQIVTEYRRPHRRFSSDIITELSEMGTGRAENHRLEESVADEIIHYTSNDMESILEEAKGTWFRGKTDSFLFLEFRVAGVTALTPSELTLFQRGKPENSAENADNSSSLSWRFSSPDSPIPMQLLSWFKPRLGDWGEGCWFTGEIHSYSKPNTNDGKPSRQTELKELSFRNAPLSKLLASVTSTQIEGELTRLTIQNGRISDGIFLGNGRIQLSQVKLQKDFLVRFQKEFDLQFQPANTLVNIFPENMVPFDRVMFDFVFEKEGVRIQASAPNRTGIAGLCESTQIRYQFNLPAESKKVTPYPHLLALFSDGGETRFWSSFYRDALNHLPVEE